MRPMIASGLYGARCAAGHAATTAGDVGDAGRAAELAGDDDQHAAVEPALDLGGLEADEEPEEPTEELEVGSVRAARSGPARARRGAFAQITAMWVARGLCLGLNYDGKGVVDVLQSTKYVTCPDVHTAVALMLADARRLNEHFEVVRLKLEAMASNPGIPRTDEDAAQMPPGLYFEHHIKLNAPVTPESDDRLKALGRELTTELGIRVPFSCNNLRGKNQRFLNARTYAMGAERSATVVERIIEAVQARGFSVTKVIEEYVVFDTNKALDGGWLEP